MRDKIRFEAGQLSKGFWVFPALAIIVLCSSDISYAQTITINNNLVFGPVFPGVPKAISKTSAGDAAEFFITGTPNAEITLDFALPTYLHTTGGNMQLIFSSTDCALDSSSTPNQSNPPVNNIDPWHTIIYRLGANGLSLWLGGTVVPGLAQKPGDYSALIVLTVTYTGN